MAYCAWNLKIHHARYKAILIVQIWILWLQNLEKDAALFSRGFVISANWSSGWLTCNICCSRQLLMKLASVNGENCKLMLCTKWTVYPHMPIGKVWIYRLLFLCLFARLPISSPRIKLKQLNFAQRFTGVQYREYPIFVNFASPEAQNWTNRPARGPRPLACKHYRRDAPS